MQRVHYDIVVKGRVQRVWYRQSTLETAAGLGIDGFAMNLPDGSVRIEAEGPREALERLVTWCRIGPPAARVEEVVVKEGPLQHHPRFHVRR
ncbi:MAG: acylphosphatase [Flavobacteriales bacterium]|nr:acylphosphatase [Flavobacteriales bacterium]